MKKIWTLVLVIAIATACKKDKKPDPTVEEAKTKLTTTIDGQKFTSAETAVTPNFYIDAGQTTGAMQIQANLDGTKSFIVFVDKLESGVINLTKDYPTQMGMNFDKSNTNTILSNNPTPEVTASAATSYVKYINAATSYFAVSGKITIEIKGKNAIISWDVLFKDATGKTFSSTGTTTIIDYKKNTKPKNQITNPTSAVIVAAINPDYAWTGTKVTITGTGFSAVNAENTIIFGGQNLAVTKSSENQLEFVVPIFTNNHKPIIEVKVSGNSTTLNTFTYLPQINSFTPSKAPIGNTIEIFGLAFPINASELEVKVGGVVAEIKENNGSYAKVTIPQNAKSGKISVSYKGKPDVLSATDFEVATGPTAGANSVPIGKSFSGAATLDFNNKNTIVDYFSGEHEVAIYQTPKGKDSEIGKGKLSITRSGNIFTMKLIGPSGNTLKQAAIDMTIDNDYNYETLTKAGATYIVTASERLNTRIGVSMAAYDNGQITGDVFEEAQLLYRFRNNVEYFGLTPPAALAELAGTWKGNHSTNNACAPNLITATIAADATVTNQGKDSFDCSVENFVQKWDGQDDFVEPNAKGFKGNTVGSMIYLNSSNGGGSSGGGSIWILVPKLDKPTTILEILSHVGGYNGILLTENPTKQ